MKKYIDFNSKKRINAANDFENDFFTLMTILFIKKEWKI